MRGSREAPIGASRVRWSRWAKVPLSGIFEGTRRLGEFVCGRIEVAQRGASNARAGQPRRERTARESELGVGRAVVRFSHLRGVKS